MLRRLGDQMQDLITEVESIVSKLEEDVMRQIEDSEADHWASMHDDDPEIEDEGGDED